GNIGYETPLRVPTLAGSWTNTGGIWTTPGYWKDADGNVHIQGTVGGGSGVIFTLPTGYRPAAAHLFPSVAGGAVAGIEVLTNGTVSLSFGTATGLSLAGIKFRT